MIFERRQYTLRPGRLEDFWEAQRTWMVQESTTELLKANLSYFGSRAGASDQILQLYRFDSPNHWQAVYQRVYASQPAEYFTIVRPWVLAQEISLLAAPPVEGCADLWMRPTPALPATVAAAATADPGGVTIVEETTDFFPGGLASYWPAYADHRKEAGDSADSHLATLVTLVGTLHRVHTYRAYPDDAAATHREAARRAEPAWRQFVERYRDEVAGSRTTLLRPSPVPRQRSLFEPCA